LTDTVLARVAALKTLPIAKLKEQWRDLFETEPPPYNRRFLEHRLAYRIQELAYGGLKPATVKRLRDLAEELDGGEAHHCYRERVKDATGETEDDLKGEEKEEAKENNEAARMWISGLETVKRKLGISLVYDLSATPFFLRGSGYLEGTLFPWTMSDFSLMDAIECGIVKLPRVPVADNVPGGDTPKFRNLWDEIKKSPRGLPKKGRSAGAKGYDPLALPTVLLSALEALYGHYQKTFELWENAGIGVPPVFIVVCNNTSTSELVYKYISGFHRENDDGSTTLENGRLALFRNYDEFGNRLARPNTILIDSAQLESGEALDKDFREMAADEIERFRRDILERGGKDASDLRAGGEIDDATLLREVMNTVGKKDRLGEQIRCVVSVSMLTEGWDANTVTHILGKSGRSSFIPRKPPWSNAAIRDRRESPVRREPARPSWRCTAGPISPAKNRKRACC
jgi:type III restriction enzyme